MSPGVVRRRCLILGEELTIPLPDPSRQGYAEAVPPHRPASGDEAAEGRAGRGQGRALEPGATISSAIRSRKAGGGKGGALLSEAASLSFPLKLNSQVRQEAVPGGQLWFPYSQRGRPAPPMCVSIHCTVWASRLDLGVHGNPK